MKLTTFKWYIWTEQASSLSGLVNVGLNLPFVTCFCSSIYSASSCTSSSRQFGFLLESMVIDYIIKSRLYIGRSVNSTPV